MSTPSLSVLLAGFDAIGIKVLEEDGKLRITGENKEALASIEKIIRSTDQLSFFSIAVQGQTISKIQIYINSSDTFEEVGSTKVSEKVPVAVSELIPPPTFSHVLDTIKQFAGYLGLPYSENLSDGGSYGKTSFVIYQGSAKSEYQSMIIFLRNFSVPFIQTHECMRTCLSIDRQQLAASLKSVGQQNSVSVKDEFIERCFFGHNPFLFPK
jgi:hypothetical protein